MPDAKLTLITGRATKQGTGISTGKEGADYREVTHTVELSAPDMAHLGLQDGDLVRIKTGVGEARVRCRRADLPEGLAYMAFGPATSELVGGETQASGMPDTKGFAVELGKISE